MTYDVESASVRQQSVGKEKIRQKKDVDTAEIWKYCEETKLSRSVRDHLRGNFKKYKIKRKHSAGNDCGRSRARQLALRGPNPHRVPPRWGKTTWITSWMELMLSALSTYAHRFFGNWSCHLRARHGLRSLQLSLPSSCAQRPPWWTSWCWQHDTGVDLFAVVNVALQEEVSWSLLASLPV